MERERERVSSRGRDREREREREGEGERKRERPGRIPNRRCKSGVLVRRSAWEIHGEASGARLCEAAPSADLGSRVKSAQ